MPRYLFLCPERRTPSGGIAVIYDTVTKLRQAGYDAVILQDSRHEGYADYENSPPLFFTDELHFVDHRHAGWRRTGLKKRFHFLKNRMLGGPLERLTIRPDDVVVVPEMMLHNAIEAFPKHRLIVFSQNPFSFMRCFMRSEDRGLNARARVQWAIGTSNICKKQLDLVGLSNTFYLPVSMKPDEFPFSQSKRKLITYMPRKRRDDAKIIEKMLRYRGRIPEYELLALDNLPRKKVSQLLQESLVFISLLKNEGLGFPAAEAMSAGCITVGFTGLGAEEFFTSDTGIPIAEGDTASLVVAVEDAVIEYETDPARLDTLRLHASNTVTERYSSKMFEETLLDVWAKIEGDT